MDPSFIPYRRAAAYLKSRLEANKMGAPVMGIICGSGLAGLSDALTGSVTVPYGDIPGFPAHCTVPGHKGEMVFGYLSGVLTLCLRGRFHSYEGHDMETVALPVRAMRCLGVKLILVTNAAGGLNPDYNVGDVVNIMDHLAIPMLAGKNPLVGANDPELGPRFPPMSNLYDEALRDVVMEAARSLGFLDFVRPSGTYCFVSGPMYESKVECRLLSSLGGDAVGMSTAPENAVAHHSGMKVLCMSLITNKVIYKGDEGPPANHEEVLEAVNSRSVQIQALVKETVRLLSASGKLQAMPDLPKVSLEVPKESKRKEAGCMAGVAAKLCSK